MWADFDRRWLAGVFVLLILAFAGGIKYQTVTKADSEQEPLVIKDLGGVESELEREEELALVQVYVCGEVENPGIYQMKAGARLHEAVETAGVKEGAELKYLGMARELTDGETIVVPVIGDPGLPAQESIYNSGSMPAALSSRLNINQASAEEMSAKLNGIGPVLAQRIVDYRTSHGSFQKIEDLQQVSGIGEKKYEGIKDSICVK